MQQAEDFRAESLALFDLLHGAPLDRFDEPTGFKSWTINDVLQHLYFWNQMAGLQITDEALLKARLTSVITSAEGMRGYERNILKDLSGRDLLHAWRADVDATADLYAKTDPKARLKWAGPEMSARSSITARLMETWAHGQEVYDHLGVVRSNDDRIKNIVVLGVNTFGWTYKVRNETPPGPM
ncbi:MAG: maleylpyruvate isomerase family mycothiol-dependent enzyme, partial [Pseudomonadota bacterium]